MQSDQDIKTDVPAAKERKVNKAEKMPRAKREARKSGPLVGHVEAVSLDLEGGALSFTITPKNAKSQMLSVEATGETRQSAIAMLLAAKFEGKKIAVTVAEQNKTVARMLEFKSKPRGK